MTGYSFLLILIYLRAEAALEMSLAKGGVGQRVSGSSVQLLLDIITVGEYDGKQIFLQIFKYVFLE